MGLLQDIIHAVESAPQAIGRALSAPSNSPGVVPTPQQAATLLNLRTNGAVTQPQLGQPVQSHPNSNFHAAPPVQTPQAYIPQNPQQNPNLQKYGDNQGNQWFEDNGTGQKYPIPKAPAPQQGDHQFNIQQPFNRTMTLPVQQQMPSLAQPMRGIQA